MYVKSELYQRPLFNNKILKINNYNFDFFLNESTENWHFLISANTLDRLLLSCHDWRII